MDNMKYRYAIWLESDAPEMSVMIMRSYNHYRTFDSAKRAGWRFVRERFITDLPKPYHYGVVVLVDIDQTPPVYGDIFSNPYKEVV